MLNSLVIILREILEAAVIISVLLASIQSTKITNSWLAWGIVSGVIGSIFIANQFTYISDSFDGVGQEIANATMLFSIAVFALSYLYLLCRYPYTKHKTEQVLKSILFIIISIAIIRECVEIIIYIDGYIANVSNNFPLILGGSIGAWIGMSSGILIYYSLLHCSPHLRLNIVILMTAILCAGMVSEGILFLIQADWIEGGGVVWDSTSIIAESSIFGQLLYAVFSYEATPTSLQVIAYTMTLLLFVLLVIITRQLNNKSTRNII